MKQPTIKYPSGLEVNLAAFLLKMTSSDISHAQRRSLPPEKSGVTDSGSRHLTANRREEI